MNFPGIPPFSLSDLISKQPIHLTMYCIEEKQQEENGSRNGKKTLPHYRCSLSTYSDFELSHTVQSVSRRYSRWVASEVRHSSTVFDSVSKVDSMEIISSVFAESRSSSATSMDSLSIPPNSSYDLLKHCSTRCG
jgi:hypothetical protein